MKDIIVDIDGVVCQYDYIRILKKHFGLAVPTELIAQYSIEEVLGVSREAVEKMFTEEVYAPPNFITGAVEALKRLTVNDYKIIIYSNRLNFFPNICWFEDWLNVYGIPFNDIVSKDTLPEYAVAMIDDHPTKLIETAELLYIGKLILFVQPWNRRCFDIKNKFCWCENWQQILEELNIG